jgi:hypothetical protein
VVAVTQRNLVVHHLAHWLMVVAGAMVGYRLRHLAAPGGAVLAWIGLAAALTWHVPLPLDWADDHAAAHVAAHATLVAGGVALGWVVPRLNGRQKGALFIAAIAVMWPVMLAELAGFTYAGYPGQAPVAGVAGLLAMAAAWPVIAAWPSLRRIFRQPSMAVGVQGLIGLAVLAGWMASA